MTIETKAPPPWLRLYHETPYDSKIRALEPVHRWIFIALLCAARRSPVPGGLLRPSGEPMSEADLADLCGPGITKRTISRAISDLKIHRILGEKSIVFQGKNQEILQFLSWEKRQFSSDHSRTRTEKWRKSGRHGDGLETSLRRSCDGITEDQSNRDAEEQTDRGEDKDKNLPDASGSGAKANDSSKPRPSQKGHGENRPPSGDMQELISLWQWLAESATLPKPLAFAKADFGILSQLLKKYGKTAVMDRMTRYNIAHCEEKPWASKYEFRMFRAAWDRLGSYVPNNHPAHAHEQDVRDALQGWRESVEKQKQEQACS